MCGTYVVYAGRRKHVCGVDGVWSGGSGILSRMRAQAHRMEKEPYEQYEQYVCGGKSMYQYKSWYCKVFGMGSKQVEVSEQRKPSVLRSVCMQCVGKCSAFSWQGCCLVFVCDIFDQTQGYPGEGPPFTLATINANTGRAAIEIVKQCRDMQCHVIIITEAKISRRTINGECEEEVFRVKAEQAGYYCYIVECRMAGNNICGGVALL
jgi:hypothetical protein